MLSIEEIKLLIEKLEKVKKEDLQKLIDSNLKILKDLELAVDANNQEEINRLDKTVDWFKLDLDKKNDKPQDQVLFNAVQSTIFKFAKSNMYNSLEIGPGYGRFSKEFRAWRLNFFLDIIPEALERVKRRFLPPHLKYIRTYITKRTECYNIPANSCNFIFSWDTFVFLTIPHIEEYLNDIKRVLIPGGYCFIHYADCHYDYDLNEAKRSYWNYNTKTKMKEIVKKTGYEILETGQFKPGSNYTIFKKPGKQNPAVYKIEEITID